jgi:hypothetical protein
MKGLESSQVKKAPRHELRPKVLYERGRDGRNVLSPKDERTAVKDLDKFIANPEQELELPGREMSVEERETACKIEQAVVDYFIRNYEIDVSPRLGNYHCRILSHEESLDQGVRYGGTCSNNIVYLVERKGEIIWQVFLHELLHALSYSLKIVEKKAASLNIGGVSISGLVNWRNLYLYTKIGRVKGNFFDEVVTQGHTLRICEYLETQGLSVLDKTPAFYLDSMVFFDELNKIVNQHLNSEYLSSAIEMINARISAIEGVRLRKKVRLKLSW